VVREVLLATSSHFDSLFALQGIGSYAITLSGTLAQRAQWLPRIASAEVLAALAVTEPEAGSDLGGIKTTLTLSGGRLHLQGVKAAISNAGIAAFYTPTGYGTKAAEGKETRVFGSRPFVLESGLTADYAFIKAARGDRLGNLVYRKTARNFNPIMATAARITIAEVEEMVEPGLLDPDTVHTPGIFVKRIFQGRNYEKRIEQRTHRPPNGR